MQNNTDSDNAMLLTPDELISLLMAAHRCSRSEAEEMLRSGGASRTAVAFTGFFQD